MRTKFSEDFFYGTINKAKHISDSQVLSDRRRTIAEDYLESRINLHLHIGFDDEEYCVVFDRDSEIGCSGDIVEEGTKSNFIIDEPSKQKVSMLIKVTQLVEFPQVLARTITYAGLKFINEINYCGADPLELSRLVTFVFARNSVDRKFVANCGSIPLGRTSCQMRWSREHL